MKDHIDDEPIVEDPMNLQIDVIRACKLAFVIPSSKR